VTGIVDQATPTADHRADGALASRRDTLSRVDREEMLALLQRHFEGVTPGQFARDLDEKDWVLRFRHGERLVGFSTLQVYRTVHRALPLNVIYSGDTIMDPEAWGSPLLARAWIALVNDLRAPRPDERWVWLLLSSGFRTYRFLPVFWKEFWPRHDAAEDAPEAALADVLARERFGTCYDAARGVVRFPAPQRLRDHLADLPEGKANDPHVRFFRERNPGHAEGDELVCLADLGDANLTAAGWRMVRQSRR